MSSEEDLNFSCEFCGRKFKNRRAIGQHIQSKSKGPCRQLHIEKYGKELKNLPWNRKIKCRNENCNNLTWVNSKTKLCHPCATRVVVKDRKRNAKLTTKNTHFIENEKVSWKCEVCRTNFLTKTELNNHAKDSKCSTFFYKKYRTQSMFPWNMYGKEKQYCKACNKVIIPDDHSLCKRCSCIKNMKNNRRVSKPQMELFEIVNKIYQNVKLEHLSLNYFIDIAIMDLKIAIEYDGSYWHQNKKYDKLRQRDLEEEGWKFIRYVDRIPSIEELNFDIQRTLDN